MKPIRFRENWPKPIPYFIPENSALSRAAETAIHAVQAGLPVLILGETGVGKDMLVKHIHQSLFANRPLMAVNCGTIPHALAESELFGKEKGAYTDAHHTQIGLIEAAKNGILFLDEIGTMPLELQPKLLRSIEDRSIRRLGSIENIPTPFHLICATNSDLASMAQSGQFRVDLLYRINQVTIQLPPLRSNIELLDAYITHFWKHYAEITHSSNQIQPDTYQRLVHHSWPGNIRELKSEIEKLFLFTAPSSSDFPHDKLQPGGHDDRMMAYERLLIRHALDQAGYNVSAAAKLLNIKRETLQKKMIRLGFSSPRQLNQN